MPGHLLSAALVVVLAAALTVTASTAGAITAGRLAFVTFDGGALRITTVRRDGPPCGT